MASKITYVGTRRTRDASYTPAARGGMLNAAHCELRPFSKPQRIDKTWWERKLGFRQDYGCLTNGETPWATLRVMMTRDADAGKGVGKRFVRFKAGFVTRTKYNQNRQWYHTGYGPPVVSKRQSALKQRGELTCCTTTCQSCGRKNDHVWHEAA